MKSTSTFSKIRSRLRGFSAVPDLRSEFQTMLRMVIPLNLTLPLRMTLLLLSLQLKVILFIADVPPFLAYISQSGFSVQSAVGSELAADLSLGSKRRFMPNTSSDLIFVVSAVIIKSPAHDVLWLFSGMSTCKAVSLFAFA